MALNIRNRETEQAVRDLARRTGLGLTEAIDMAVRAQLDSRDVSQVAVQRRRERAAQMRQWLDRHVDVSRIRDEADLYDEHGMPR